MISVTPPLKKIKFFRINLIRNTQNSQDKTFQKGDIVYISVERLDIIDDSSLINTYITKIIFGHEKF